MELDLQKVGDNIRIARAIKGFSQEGLANSVGKSQNWMQKVEKGELDLTISAVEELAKSLGVPSSNLLYSSLGQVFNHCNIGNAAQNFNNCVFNNEEIFEKFIEKVLNKKNGL